MNDFKNYKVNELPDCAYYIPNFITPDEESVLLEKVYSSPKPKWKTLLNRRLQNWGGLPHAKGMIQENLPEWLLRCVRQVSGVFGDKTPNHVLVNEYLPGQGIMPHEDGPLFYPTIATITLSSHTVLDYYKKEGDSGSYVGSLLLDRCSLLLVKGDLYTSHLHGIQERSSDTLDHTIKNLATSDLAAGTEVERGTRVSLTIRHVPHTLKAKFMFGIK
ncbi:hypothetical protein JTE90_006101 [Oedothorax gibbosus]|uniref:Fe2OG dioxygenase domain-containing protein n=1 Tax=Oedothorax gibbosus TaxID=931172 RepID=A0AAV6V3S8_9ARAC|nr:hypothetical protein JTE90_006101 [Oedothorax gibbosus]